MRRTYKERKYYCGEYMEVDIFPVYTNSKRRNARKKPTTEIQKHLNRKHSEGKLRRLLHTNFNQSDLFVTLTFNDDTLPATVEDAQRLLQNFLRRVKRVYGKMGLDVKYIYVLEYGTKHNRLHIHLVMSGGISREALTKLWGLGAVSLELLHFGKDGLAALARYLTKGSEDDDRLTWKRWSGSRNLEKPRVSEREGRLSHRKMTDLCLNGGEADYLENQFNGYEMADFAPAVYEDIYGGYYLSVMMKKQTTRTDAWSDFEGLPF